MNKKLIRIFLFLLAFFILFPFSASAVQIGTMTYSSEFDRYRYTVGANQYDYMKYKLVDGNTVKAERTFTPSQVAGATNEILFYCNGTLETEYYKNGSLYGTGSFDLTQVKNEKLTMCDGKPTSPSDPPGEEPDDPKIIIIRDIHFEEYMAKLNEIIAKIPPAPNWDTVAKTFRDTIAPQIKRDLQEILGSAPTKPPKKAVPPKGSGLNNGGMKTPNIPGEAPGLGNSSFKSSDIKNQAPKIQERNDPTGGFNLSPNDPISSLPSQEEFRKNVPNEGEAPLPNDPIKDSEDNIAPNPPNENIGYPDSPTDIEINPPTPGDGIESDFTKPPIPQQGTETPPTPGQTEETPPIPGQSNETAPIPGQTNEKPPIP